VGREQVEAMPEQPADQDFYRKVAIRLADKARALEVDIGDD
jgi:hypothetical protein